MFQTIVFGCSIRWLYHQYNAVERQLELICENIGSHELFSDSNMFIQMVEFK